MAAIPAEERTVVHVLRRAVAEFPERTWFANDAGRFTYRDIDTLSNRLAHGFLAQGLNPGDTVLFMLPDVTEYVATWAACSKAGVIEVPVNVAYRGDILVHIVNDSRATSMVCAAEFLDRLEAIAERLDRLETVFVYGGDDDADIAAPALERTCDLRPFQTLISNDASALDHLPAISDHKAIMYTSGTTGPSKGVMVSQAHAFEYANGAASGLEVGPDDVYYTAGLPLFHVAGKWGVIYAVAIHGATAAFPTRFSATEFWSDVRKYGATTTFLLGAMANFLQRQPEQPDDADTPLAKVLMCPLLPDLEEFERRFGTRTATAYGSTEVGAPVFMPLDMTPRDVQFVGPVRDDKFELAILDENDNRVPPGVLGEIAVRTKEPWLTMLGYWHQPEWTLRTWRNQWLHSGDAGRADEDGNIYFVDRIKDAIRRRGENISSMEVEGIVSQHPAIAECAVYPIASEYSEQEVAVTVVTKPDQTLDMEDLIRWLEPRMPYFMVPRYVTLAPGLPKTPTGKIQKYPLREQGVTANTWDREAAGVTVSR